jgi:hypothetical protein
MRFFFCGCRFGLVRFAILLLNWFKYEHKISLLEWIRKKFNFDLCILKHSYQVNYAQDDLYIYILGSNDIKVSNFLYDTFNNSLSDNCIVKSTVDLKNTIT